MTDLVHHISEIARLFWGPENRALSSRTELRWEKRRPRGQSQHRTVVRPFRVCRRRRCRLNATALRAICVAAGIPFAGLKTLQGPVIYNCGEGNSGFVARLFAAGRRLGVGRDDSLPLFVLDEAPDFGHERCSSQCDRPGDVVRRPTARVGHARHRASKTVVPPLLVYLAADTLAWKFCPAALNDAHGPGRSVSRAIGSMSLKRSKPSKACLR